MNAITYVAFKDELQKIASGWSHAAELGGLGLLAAPSVAHLRGKEWSEKNKARAEVGGLGILAAPTAIGVAKKGLGALRKFKRASADSLADGALSLFKKADADFWNANTGELVGQGSRMPGRAKAVAQHGLHTPKPKFGIEQLKGAYSKAGLKPGLGSVARVIGKHASINKEALFGLDRIGALAKKVPEVAAKSSFKPSFQGHTKSLGVGLQKSKSGVETMKSFNPMTQTLSQKKSISIPGLT